MSFPFYCINFHNTWWCFWSSLKISIHFLKILQNLSKDQTNPYEKFPIESFLKFFKGNQWLSKTYKKVLRMFCSCTNKFKCSLRDKNVIKNKIFICVDVTLTLTVPLSTQEYSQSFHAKKTRISSGLMGHGSYADFTLEWMWIKMISSHAARPFYQFATSQYTTSF